MSVRRITFPDQVDEVSARLVAGGVVLGAVATIVFDLRWLTAVLAYGFVARAFSGPTFSPLAQLVTRVIRPALPVAPRLVAGAPKRFAQGIGAVFTITAWVLTYAFGQFGAAQWVLAALIGAASLEAVFGLCLGCKIYAALIRAGVFPESACQDCADISRRLYA